jgi:hypothetical protein
VQPAFTGPSRSASLLLAGTATLGLGLILVATAARRDRVLARVTAFESPAHARPGASRTRELRAAELVRHHLLMDAAAIEPMTAGHWPETRAVFEQGIATGDATFETAAPSWADWDAATWPATGWWPSGRPVVRLGRPSPPSRPLRLCRGGRGQCVRGRPGGPAGGSAGPC